MKTAILIALAITLISASAVAQENSQASRHDVATPKPLLVSGRVSPDGKVLTTDLDSEWNVSNADILKGHEGKLVRVKCLVDTLNTRLQILTIKNDDGSANYTAARSTDSAFRR